MENCAKACVVCFDNNKSVRQLKPDHEVILKAAISGFRLTPKFFPTGICCYFRVIQLKHGPDISSNLTICDYKTNKVLYNPRADPCSYIVCEGATLRMKQPNIYCTKKKSLSQMETISPSKPS